MKASKVFKVGNHNIGWVDSDFTREFGEEEVNLGSVLKFQTLKKNMRDSEIISKLGIQGCTLGDVLATINGATEDMKDGYANIFYVKDHPSRVVCVLWLSVYGRWFVSAWSRDG